VYGYEQTLRLKGTDRLFRLVGNIPVDIREFAGTVEYPFIYAPDTTFVISENGVYYDCYKLSEFTHLEDEFGRPISSPPRKGEYVSEICKKYVKYSSSELQKMRERGLNSKIRDIFRELRECGNVRFPFSDGGTNVVLRKYFIDKVKARPLFKFTTQHTDKSNYKGHGSNYMYTRDTVSKELVFKRNRKKYLITENEICLITNRTDLPKEFM